ncbi:hypothetical protein Aple_003150 [Acrocarpospora pleiomorpha]|uniref:Uncharacterized protein n=1 Tax=Acrocarpospora pleiomorpha TaxID=90975 RepID=A0A5M3X8J6_9ACTN|nr:hypothetical protein [Acrocarpospora pleiomorpha]GES17420.1 hypothetical protein Aple_003150 [Acrocarpospora pleiomorpha]
MGRDWAHRQAGLYPTHIHLQESRRRRALDFRPTLNGWMDLAERSVERYLHDDGTSRYSAFPDFSAEPMLSELFDRLRAYFGMHAPLGQVGAEKGLARLCWLLAKFEYLFHNDASGDPIYRWFREGTATVEKLHAAADDASVDELVELTKLLHMSGSLEDLRRLAGNPPLGRPWGIARPVVNSRWADHDLVIGDRGDTTLIDVNTVSKTNNSTRAQRWIWRLLCCAWLDITNAYRIKNVGLYFARYGELVTWPVTDLAEELFEGADVAEARRDFLSLTSRLREKDLQSAMTDNSAGSAL